MGLQQKITDLVTEASKENILSIDALQEINNIVLDHESMVEDNRKLTKKVLDLEGLLKTAHGKLAQIDLRENNLAIRDGEVTKREEKILELELTAKYEAVRVNDHIAMVAMVFRNSVLKRSMYGNVPAPMSDDGMISTQTVGVSEDREEKLE